LTRQDVFGRLSAHTETTKKEKMRTKTLLLTAALGVACAATTMAQVYSVNAVGYVNTALAKGWNMISNPLQNQQANTVATLLAGVPAGTMAYKFTNGSYEPANIYDPDLGGWSDTAQTCLPGEGLFVNVPSAVTVTFVGEVLQGDLVTALVKGWNIASSKVPQTGKLQTDLNFPAAAGQIFYTYNAAQQKYDPQWAYDPDLGGWAPEEPTIPVGGAFWVQAPAATSWTRTFHVN
jgi:hypothetical protein